MSAFSPRVRTVGAALRRRADADPDGALLKCGTRWWTAGQLDAVSDRVAAGLHARGLAHGDRLAILCGNREEYFILVFAAAKLGAIVVPINPFLRGQFLAYQLEDSGAKIIATDHGGRGQLTALGAIASVKWIVEIDATHASSVDTVTWSQLKECRVTIPVADVAPNDLMAIMYTSGTTGPPKGCMLSHGYFTYFAAPWAERGWVAPGDRVFSALPLYHTGGHLAVMFALMLDGTSTCLDTVFSASSFIPRAAAENASCLFGIGVQAAAILQQPSLPSDDHHPFRIAGFPPLHPDDQDRFEQRFATPVIAEGIGQTEITPGLLDPVFGPRKRGANGTPSDHVHVRLVDDHGAPVAVGEVGELTIRPKLPDVMFSGYWQNPEATAEAWQESWFRTGDYFSRDEEGFYAFLDRKSDFLRRRGENISSFQLERAIARHADVAQVAVCAIPSDLADIEIKACIVPAPGSEIDLAELFAFFKDELPYFAVPRYVEIRSGLPLTDATNRVQKAFLRREGITANTHDLHALGFVIAQADRRG